LVLNNFPLSDCFSDLKDPDKGASIIQFISNAIKTEKQKVAGLQVEGPTDVSMILRNVVPTKSMSAAAKSVCKEYKKKVQDYEGGHSLAFMVIIAMFCFTPHDLDNPAKNASLVFDQVASSIFEEPKLMVVVHCSAIC